jgi:hypothetical protein
MSTDRTDHTDECTTTGSFGDHGVDGRRLIEGTYRRLAAAELRAFEDTAGFYRQLESAFLWAYLAAVDEPGVPDHVAYAVDDALAWTRERFADADDPDVRTEVVPAFYREAARFHCAYR